MDVKIVSALNDLTLALDAVAESLKDKSAESESGKILQSIDNIDKKMESISNGLKSIKKDTTQILKNQETLLKISNDKKTDSKLFETAGKNKAKIKDGVSTVLLIAAGVLAIGLAFKIIGSVDFFSVIALSIALPLIAIAFEKISEMKELKKADMKNIFFVTVTMAASITAASWIMRMILPISIAQGLTAIFISGIFYLTTLNLEKIRLATLFLKNDEMKKMGLVLLGITGVIVASSWLFQAIMPISFAKGLTAIIISGIFYLITLNLEKIRLATLFLKNDEMKKMGLILLGLSGAIVASSWLFQAIAPITIEKALSAIAVAGVLAIIALALPSLALAVRLVSLKDAYLMVGILPAVALAMMVSSHIIALGNYKEDNYPSLDWALGVGASILAFGLATIGLGYATMTGIGYVAMIVGGVAVLLLSGIIVVASQALTYGDYKSNYPSLDWAEGVGASILTFGLATIGLGAFILGSLGAGLLVLAAGAKGVMTVATAIKDASLILKDGEYTKGPTKDWAEGISLSLGAFAPIFKTLFDRGIIGIFKKGPSAEDFAEAIKTISKGIVAAGEFFSKTPDIWKGGPTKDWAEGVGGAIGAFAPVFDALSESYGLFGSGPSTDDMIKAMRSISEGIVSVASYFKDIPDNIWTGGPDETWSGKISSALQAFAPVFDYLNQNTSWLSGADTDKLRTAVVSIAYGMVEAANSLNEGKFTANIPEGYMKSLSDNVKMYVDLVEYLESKDLDSLSFLSVLGITSGLSKLAEGYEKLSKGVESLGNALGSIDMEKIEALNRISGSIILMSLMDSDQFESMMDALEAKAGIFVKVVEELQGEAEKTGKSSSYPVGNMGGKGSSATSALEQKMDQLVANTTNLAANIGSAVANSIKSPFETLIAELKNQMGKKERKAGTK